jgi:internalin A
MTEMQRLHISNAYTRDITPLAEMTDVRELWLRQVMVRDLSPLNGMTQLKRLKLTEMAVNDLKPLAHLTSSAWAEQRSVIWLRWRSSRIYRSWTWGKHVSAI